MKKKKGFLIMGFMITYSLLIIHCLALGQIYSAKLASVNFFSSSPLENVDATNKSVQSILNTSAKTVAFIVPIRGFKFKDDLMEEHFNEKYLESDKYPNATYSGRINEDVDLSKDGTYQVTSTGKLTMHGVEQHVTQKGTAIVKNGEISVQSKFPIAIKDFNITIPKLLFQNIADTVAVTVNIVYQNFKK
jgi:hypothetical protein